MARSPLLLVVHGRAGGAIPGELRALAAEAGKRRGGPVALRALTEPLPGRPPLPPPGVSLTLVPLFLLPGAHVRSDLPALTDQLRREGVRVRALPFLGAWPQWQRALAREVAGLSPSPAPPGAPPPARQRARLLHHPLPGRLGERFLAHLEAVLAVRCQATPYSSADLEELKLAITGPALPLALAANRLTDALGDRLGPPLLARPGCLRAVLERLEALP